MWVSAAVPPSAFDPSDTPSNQPPPPPLLPTPLHPSATKGEPLASHTIGSAPGFALRLLTTWRTTVLVTYVAAEDSPQLAAPSSAPAGGAAKRATTTAGGISGGGSVCASPQAWAEEVRGLLAAVLGKPKLASGLDDFVTFGLYWGAIRRGDTAAAARLADARDKI